ncbi:beta family protein [Rhizobium etli]
MFDGRPYFPAMSTRVHEEFAYSKCPDDVKDAMVPIVTLTRYAKGETLLETATVLLEDLGSRPAIVDFDPEPKPTTSVEEATERRRRREITRAAAGQKAGRPRSEKELANDEKNRKKTEAFNRHIIELTDPTHGAVRWVDMISDLPQLIPVLRATSSEQISSQLEIVKRKGTRGAFRIKPGDAGQVAAFFQAVRYIRESAGSLLVIVDVEDIRGRFRAASAASTDFLSRLYEGLGDDVDRLETVLLSNSFPKTSLKDMPRRLEIEELGLHREISKTFSVGYGDYMSIPPRTSSIVAANGWFPHVDLVASNAWHICLYENNSDQTKYVAAAKDTTESDQWASRADCWGTSIIERVAEGDLTIDGKKFTTPTAWLSVRANQHITQMALSR